MASIASTAAKKKTAKIVKDRVFPYPRDIVWTAITDKRAISTWLMRTDTFEPKVGCRFRLDAKPVPGWRGYVECEVLEVDAPRKLVVSWLGMPNQPVTTVTWELTEVAGGTRLDFVHDGFTDEHGYFAGFFLRAMLGSGWKKMFTKILPLVLEHLARRGPDAPYDEPALVNYTCKYHDR